MGKTAADWDKAYAGPAPFGDRPCPGLVQTVARLPVDPGAALMIADGDGRNGTWLATNGWHVTAVDHSPAATEHALARDAAAGVSAVRITDDLETWSLGTLSVAFATILYLQVPSPLRHRALQVAADALSIGGHLFIECFAGTADEDAPLGPPGEVRWDLPTTLRWLEATQHFTVLEALAGTILLDDGPRHAGMAHVMRLLVRRER
ncbi:MAG: methyltransferase domain-containing protein [Pseudomonadota bacterium]